MDTHDIYKRALSNQKVDVHRKFCLLSMSLKAFSSSWQRDMQQQLNGGGKERKLFHYHDNNLLFSNACPHYGNSPGGSRPHCNVSSNEMCSYITFSEGKTRSFKSQPRKLLIPFHYDLLENVNEVMEFSSLSSRLCPLCVYLESKKNNLCIFLIENLLRWLMMIFLCCILFWRKFRLISYRFWKSNEPQSYMQYVRMCVLNIPKDLHNF